MITLALAIIVCTLVINLLLVARKVNQHWSKRDVKHLKPLLFFGNSLPAILMKKHILEIYEELWNKYPDEPLLGFYDCMTPRLIVHDAEFIEKVLIKDFQHFTDHGLPEPDEKINPITHYQLFTLSGAKWRAFRYKMSPIFTSGKLKQFYEYLDICGNRLIEFMEKHPKNDIVLKDVSQRMISDFVGMSIFGIDPKSIDNPDTEYQKMSNGIFDLGYIKFFLLIMAPKLSEKLRLSFISKKHVDYFCGILKEAIAQRQKTGIQRNDFIQMMMQLKEKGKIEVQKWDSSDEYLKGENQAVLDFELTDMNLMSQAFTFLTTGLDTISVSLLFIFYELSRHPEIQSRVREEILEQTKLHSGLSYDTLRSMTYVEKVINESARLHPIVITIIRICTKDYTFPNGLTIKEGELLHIPIHSVHKNPKYFPEPLEFKPERFDEPPKPGTFFPFGDGPRVCIAMRFALLQLKYIMAKLLTHYEVELSPKTKLPFKYQPSSLITQPNEPVYFNFKPLKTGTQ